MCLDPLRVACWRFEQIAPLIETHLAPSERHRLIDAMAGVPVLWPSGRQAPIPVSTIYRWIAIYKDDPRIESLQPKARVHRTDTMVIEPKWLQYALALLEEQPKRSFFILTLKIRDRFQLPKLPSRSSLQRAFANEPRYLALRRRARGETKLRCRFQATEPHAIWHADAKSNFTVTFTDGTTRRIKILTILDDATRYVLRSLIVSSESIPTAVATFRQAAARFGLPKRFYVDRGSAYDSDVFRKGLAILGVHRINTKPRNPSAHGKIEAYNRTITRWFIDELPHQPLRDLAHLQALLDAVVERVYHQHVHRELKQTPQDALGGRLSDRRVSLQRLQEAFWIEKNLLPDKKTGTVRVGGILFRVTQSSLLPRRRAQIIVDPENQTPPCLRLPTGRLEPLKPAMRKAGARSEPNASAQNEPEPAGSLTPLLEQYRGRTLPQARPGFGLPEIYQAFSQFTGRHVPATETEAALIVQWLHHHGPFDPLHFQSALAKTRTRFGPGRPVVQILGQLTELIKHPSATNKEKP